MTDQRDRRDHGRHALRGGPLLCLLLLSLVVALAATHAASPDRSLLGAVSVKPMPSVKVVEVNQQFILDIYIYAGSNPVNAADVHLAFDPNFLQLTGAPTGGALPNIAGNAYNNSAGTIDFGAYYPGGNVSGDFRLCRLNFLARRVTSGAGTMITSRGSLLVVAPGGATHTAAWQDGRVIINTPPTPTTSPTPSITPTPSNTPTITPTFAPVPGEVCVSVYHDANQDLVRDAGEALLAGAWITVTDLSHALIADYLTDGVNEPHCFSLPAGMYHLEASSPPGYAGHGPQAFWLSVSAGSAWTWDFAQLPGAAPTPTATSTPTSTPTSTGSITPQPTDTATATPSPTPVSTSVVIDPLFGGELGSPYGDVHVQVPGGAYSETITLIFTYITGPRGPIQVTLGAPPVPSCLLQVGDAFRLEARDALGNPVTELTKPVTLTVCYDPADVSGELADVRLFRWDSGLGAWVQVAATHDTGSHCFVAQVQTLGDYALGIAGTCLHLPLIYKQGSVALVLHGSALPRREIQYAYLPIAARQRRQLTAWDRFGLAVIGIKRLAEYPLERLPFGWYLNYDHEVAPPKPAGQEFVQLVPIDDKYPPDWDEVEEAVGANRGALWIIGNEPEGPYVGNRTPEEYAEIYHTYHTFLRARDPSCQVAIGGVIQPTPLRLEWLDRLLAAYEARYGQPMPVDVWNIHNMVLREAQGDYGCGIPAGLDAQEGMPYPWWENDSITHFQDQVYAFRQWMADHGQRDKWLIISEFGVLYPSAWFDDLGEPGGDARVLAFMEATLDFLFHATDDALGCPSDGNRLVQRWAWFSLNNPSWTQRPEYGFNGNLCDPFTRTLTPFGEHYETLLARFLSEDNPALPSRRTLDR